MNSINTEAKILEPKKQLNLYGYNRYFDFFSKVLEKNKIPNALLFSGPKGIGKSTFAYHIINHILSKNENNKYSIENFTISEENLSYKLIDSNTHPNFFLIENKISEREIKIEQIRKLHQFLHKSTYSRNLKIVMIDNAESFNLNSSNALLKELEEPKDNTFFFIVNDNTYKIPETVKSRCIEFKIFFSHNEKKNIFKDLIDQYDLKIDYNEIIHYLDFDTPGNLLRYLFALYDANISLNEDKISIIFHFIDKYKTERNPEKLSIISFLIEKFYNDLILAGDNDLNAISSNYRSILNQLNNMKKFSLDEKNTLISIKDILKNEAR